MASASPWMWASGPKIASITAMALSDTMMPRSTPRWATRPETTMPLTIPTP
jgi:hypothetical protein